MKRYLLTILLSLWCVCAWAAGSVTVRGRVLCGGRGVEGVWVSDGEEFARTDKRGNYSLEAGADNRFVFVCVPAGYDAPVEKGVVRYFPPLPAEGKSCDFTLLRRAGDDSRYGFIAIADPQIWAPKEFAKLAAAADDIAATVRSYGGMPFHGICCGDIVSHDHSLYGRYNEVMERTGITFRNAMGNHDMKLWGRSHETSAAAFEAMYGPAYYSYNVGEVHYAVLNDNYYIGRDWYYIGYLEERQLAWLERDRRWSWRSISRPRSPERTKNPSTMRRPSGRSATTGPCTGCWSPMTRTSSRDTCTRRRTAPSARGSTNTTSRP